MSEFPDLETYLARFSVINERILAAGGDLSVTSILPVTKAFGPEAVRLATSAGCEAVGENYAQELLEKHVVLGDEAPSWHFIGQLQTNKVRKLAPIVKLWQSVDRPSLVAELSKRAPGASILVQVAISNEPQKGGVLLGDASELIESARVGGLDVVGLMGVASIGSDAEIAKQFASLRSLADAESLAVCSMGMTSDLELAVAQGSTMVRVGRALFGPRVPRAGL